MDVLINKDGQTEKEFLKSYDPDKYKKPSVTVDMLIFTVGNREESNYRKLPDKELKLLLIKRGDHPFIGSWALPGGFVNIDESLEDAARRELSEETGLDDIYMEQLYAWGDTGRDPRMRVISCSYMALVDSSSLKVEAGDDADDARWFSVKSRVLSSKSQYNENGNIEEKLVELRLTNGDIVLTSQLQYTKTISGRTITEEVKIVKKDGIAFDHAKIIQYGIERLKNKIEYTDIAFKLMPEYFSLTELQQVYEIILDTELLKANFRRKVQNMVLETNRTKKDAGHRPAVLYKFNSEWKQNRLGG